MPTNSQVARKIQRKHNRKTVVCDFSVLIPFYGNVQSPYGMFSSSSYVAKEIDHVSDFYVFLIQQLQGGRIDGN